MRFLYPLLSLALLLGLAAPAAALDLTDPLGRLVFDSDCTDSFDTPAVSVTTDILTHTNWDSISEAIDPDANLGDATQTSGSADGWCDSTPWVISGAITTTASRDLYVGPVSIDGNGLMLSVRSNPNVTSYQTIFMFDSADEGVQDAYMSTGANTTTNPEVELFGPWEETGGDVSDDAGNVPIPTAPLYLRFDLNGTGTFGVDWKAWPIKAPQPRR